MAWPKPICKFALDIVLFGDVRSIRALHAQSDKSGRADAQAQSCKTATDVTVSVGPLASFGLSLSLTKQKRISCVQVAFTVNCWRPDRVGEGIANAGLSWPFRPPHGLSQRPLTFAVSAACPKTILNHFICPPSFLPVGPPW